MNMKQREYALARISAIEKVKIESVQEKYAIPARFLSKKDKADLINSGAVKLRPGVHDGYRSVYWDDAFDSSAYEADNSYKNGFEEAADAVRYEARRIRDNLMLGDAQEALAALRSFENLEV